MSARETINYRDLLVKNNYVYLIQNLRVDALLTGYMREAGHFSEANCDDILCCKTKQEKNREFISILETRGLNAFKVFIKALVGTDQGVLADRLHKGLAEVARSELGAAEGAELGPSTQATQPTESKFMPMEAGEMLLPICVQKVTREDALKILGMKGVYEMTHKPRGRCVIISNEDFEPSREKGFKMDDRQPSANDAFNLNNLFSNLLFKTVVWKDLTADEMRSHILKESKRADHNDADAFVMCVLSHGTEGAVYGVDGELVSIDKDIVGPFHQNRCLSLLGKPKVFLFQACQGLKSTKGVAKIHGQEQSQGSSSRIVTCHGHDGDGKGKGTTTDHSDSGTDASPIAKFGDMNLDHDPKPGSHEHEVANILEVYSTVPGYLSYKEDLGSWFIRAFVHEVGNAAHQGHLLDILIDVAEQVKHKMSDPLVKGGEHNIQACLIKNVHFKRLYFLPGYKG